MLQVKDIETFYRRSQVLFGVSLAVDTGEVVTVMGRNGMGKTTMVRSILGLTPARSGSIRFEGVELRNKPSYFVARAGVALVPEGRQVFPTLTVRENLLATAANRLNATHPWNLETVFELFPLLAERKNAYGRTLSGGEQLTKGVHQSMKSIDHGFRGW